MDEIRRLVDNAPMGKASIFERVRDGAEALARKGADSATFAAELTSHVARSVPHSAACVITLDPATGLLTGTYKFGLLAGKHHLDGRWAEIEYGTEDPTRLSVIAGQKVPACATSHLPGGIADSVRMRQLIAPNGFGDELRMVARSNGQTWGGLNLFRTEGDAPFTEDEVAAVAVISDAVAEGIRCGLVARCAIDLEPAPADTGPLVLIIDARSGLQRVSTGAGVLLEELTSEPNRSPAESMISSLVTYARRFAAGLETGAPRTRLRLPTGRWLVAHAAPLASSSGATGEIVVTIDDARPPEIVPLLVAAFGLTDREREVAELVLSGIDTKGIASSLSMSSYTVQDHLKSIFDKADVRSRRELMARVFFDQYAPRLGTDVAPSGWFRTPT